MSRSVSCTLTCLLKQRGSSPKGRRLTPSTASASYKLRCIHSLKPSACVRVRGADAAGSLQDCFSASGVMKSGYGGPGTSQDALNNYFQSLTYLARECGLPASTVKLSPPPLNTCVGASTWYTEGYASLHRYLHACVRVRARAVVDMHVCS